eukprot:evm.model.NODE_50009_length_22169_cov_29.700077.1
MYRALLASLLGHCDALDPFLVAWALKDAMDVDAGQMDRVRVEFARLQQLLYFGDADLAGTG